MKRLVLVLALVCAGASAARADWEYTRWGMTPAEVARAAKNLTKAGADLHPDSDGNVTKLVAPYKSGDFSFEAQFGFDAASRLASVTLVLEDKTAAGMGMGGEMDHGAMDHTNMDHGNCSALKASVRATYGKPQGGGEAHMQYRIETWADPQNKNAVAYTVLDGVGCYVQYSVLKGPR